MFSGKGGVGKTTCAAATALHYSLKGEKTLIISTDPTPSICHIFKTIRYNAETQIADNLFLEEIGLSRVKQMWDSRFGKEVYEVFSSFVDIKYDQFVDFMSSILPGMRDEFMVDYIRLLYETGKYRVIVWDTAPFGQTLALLGMPSMLRGHMKMAPKIYSRFKTGQDSKKPILDILKGWDAISLKDKEFLKSKVSFNVVTIPEALAVEQLDEIFAEFAGYGIRVQRLLINNVIRDIGSDFLTLKAQQQQKYIESLYSKYSGMEIIQLPMFPTEIKGFKSLADFEKELFRQN
jgi:arsenite/tail-anchored protein-transporting ATPase